MTGFWMLLDAEMDVDKWSRAFLSAKTTEDREAARKKLIKSLKNLDLVQRLIN